LFVGLILGIGDDVLDLYVVEDLYPYWQKLGRKFKLSQSFLDDTFERFPANPAEQLRAVLHEWQARTPHATVAVLNRSLEELDLQDFIPRKRKKGTEIHQYFNEVSPLA